MRHRFTPVLIMAIALGAWLVSSDVEAATHNWCVRWGTGFLDSNIGEDLGTSSSWYGRGAKVAVTPPGGSVQTYYASPSTGCFSFSHAATSGFGVKIYAETRIGGANNIRVRAFSDEAALDAWLDFPLNDNLEHWEWVSFSPSCTGGTCAATLSTSPTTDPVAMLIAAGTWTVHTIDNDTNPRLAGTRELFLVNEECPGCSSNNCSCQGRSSDNNPHVLFIQPGDSGQRRKFLIGHEVGHWLHHQWVGGWIIDSAYAATMYDVDDVTATACDSFAANVPGKHAMRSQEHQTGAYLEGFAHYLSALAYNSHNETDGWFKYYKDTTTPNYTYDLIDIEAVGGSPAGGAVSWMRAGSGCDCEASYLGCEGYGVEMDWLRQFWDYRTNASPASIPTRWDIFDQAHDAYVA
jgi:hypothetical protein